MQLLVDNICRPAPNITHLLLRFDVNGTIERTILKPKSHYRWAPTCAFMCNILPYIWTNFHCTSCLKIILDNLEKVTKPDINALLHEFSFQVCFVVSVLRNYISRSIILRISLSYLHFPVWIQLLYELCLDPLTCGPVMDLLSTKKYQFFSKVMVLLCSFELMWPKISVILNFFLVY